MVREERIRNELSRERDECRMMQEARQREDAVFHAYAQQQLKELTIRGKTAVPVLAILEGDKLKASRAGNFQVMNFR